MRTWIKLIPAVLLAVPFTGFSLHAQETTDQKIKNLQDDVAKIRRDVESLKDEVRRSSVQAANVATDLQDIKRLLHDMAERQTVISRQSAYDPRSLLPAAPPGAPPLPATGTITVQNNYAAPATVRINGQPYAVGVGQARAIYGVPVGNFQYSVDVEGFGTVEPPRTDTLPATGYRITIFPRMTF